MTKQERYETFKTIRANIEAARTVASDRLHAIPGIGSGPMGLTPDAIRATPEYRSAKYQYDGAFLALQHHNGKYCREFASEIRADIHAEHIAKLASRSA